MSDYNLCYPVKSTLDATLFLNYLENALNSVAQFGYPYPLLMDISWPVIPVCTQFLNSTPQMGAVLALNLWFNSSRTTRPCFDYKNLNVQNVTGIEIIPWSYQTCTEINMFYTSNGVTDMFWNSSFTYTQYTQFCQLTQRTTPDKTRSMREFDGPYLSDASNIVFVNGGHDPVRAFSPYMTIPSQNITIITIPNAGHCLDLYPTMPEDYPELTAARLLESQIIAGWLGV